MSTRIVAGSVATDSRELLTAGPERRLVEVTVVPGARSAGIVGPFGDGVKVRLRSPADRGRANEELVQLIAARLGVRVGAVNIDTGHSSRKKRISVEDIPAARVLSMLLSRDQ